MTYKKQIEESLANHQWTISNIDETEAWWDDEHWKIQLNYDSNRYFYLCFIVDPHFEESRKKGQGISQIKATKQFPFNWNDETHDIAILSLTEGNFDKNLKHFIAEIENFKQYKSS